ncbi:hypothetical protein OG936_21780 [Streptomyces sp. NBC_00846]|uniref:hypothetical protein n=1 Tax=Streptomyces sp. NBC_00846 TaxID=2975849 RepID=UPI00386E4B60|nr:hypothetical protein OG936_21780 [Streptomyces sp. NBC_00846]
MSGEASLDLAAWWAAAAVAPVTPAPAHAPATARLEHRLGIARLHLAPRPAGPGRWHVDVTLTVHGRWLLRPVAALALLLAGARMRRGFLSSVEQAAEQWNEALGRVRAMERDELRAKLADYVVRNPETDEGRESG